MAKRKSKRSATKKNGKSSLGGCLVIIFGLIVVSALSNNPRSSSTRRITAPTLAATAAPVNRSNTADKTATTSAIETSIAADSRATSTPEIAATSNTQLVAAAASSTVIPTQVIETTEVQPTSAPPTVARPTSALPTPVPARGQQAEVSETWFTTADVNVRSCERTDCSVITRLSPGTQVEVIGWTQGETVNSNDIWRRVRYEGQEAYIHSGLLSVNAPQPTSPPIVIQVPQQASPVPDNLRMVSTEPPPPVSQANWNCSTDYDCGDFENRCTEMRSYIAACPGDPSGLDGNSDGEYCESYC